MSAEVPGYDPKGTRYPAPQGQRPITAEDLQSGPDISPPAQLPEPVPGGPSPEMLSRVRRSSPAIKLRLLLRCHEAAARSSPPRKIVGCVLFPLALLLGVAFVSVVGGGVRGNIEQHYGATRGYDFVSGYETGAAIAAVALFGLFGLWLVLFGRRPKPVSAQGVEKQIAAIIMDHPDAVREWGGEWVLRDPALVAEILRFEERREAAAVGPRPKPS